jgi:hypothetical protein
MLEAPFLVHWNGVAEFGERSAVSMNDDRIAPFL